MAYFTFQWAEKTWEDGKAGYREGDSITYVASNQFERAGIPQATTSTSSAWPMGDCC
jgi:hypothetical protein